MPVLRRHAARARTAVFAPLGEAGRAVRVEQRLAEAIRGGLLADGERLPSEAELASMLGVATVTAREALMALRAQGLVTTTRGRGGGSFVVRPAGDDDRVVLERLGAMTRVELHDRATLYSVLLTGCAEVAAERADKSDTEDLRELLPAPDEDDVSRWRHAEAELVLSLAALTQSARMTREVVQVEAGFGALARLPLDDQRFRDDSRARRLALLDALEAHDGDAARAAVRGQVQAAVKMLALRQASMSH